MGQVLGIVYRCLAKHLIIKAGFTGKRAQIGAVTLIHRCEDCTSGDGHAACRIFLHVTGPRANRRYKIVNKFSELAIVVCLLLELQYWNPDLA